MTDKDVLNYFNKWKYIPWKRVKQEYKDYLLNRFKDTIFYKNIVDTLKECISRLRNNIEEIPKCPICGKPRKSYLYWYGQSCGDIKCSAKIQTETYLNNIHKKYGDNISNYTQSTHFLVLHHNLYKPIVFLIQYHFLLFEKYLVSILN